MLRPALILLATLALAGCADHSGHRVDAMHSGDIAPGAEVALTFAKTARYELHCDPHSFMLHNVTVEQGAMMEAHVHIWDGNATEEFRFEPAELTVGPGARVVYHNHGRFVHTASEMTAGMQH